MPKKRGAGKTSAHAVKQTAAVYNMGTVSRLCGLPVYTIRWIESRGLISPARSGGHQRLFSDEDVRLLHDICMLMQAHVNLQGIRLILEMRSRQRLDIDAMLGDLLEKLSDKDE